MDSVEGLTRGDLINLENILGILNPKRNSFSGAIKLPETGDLLASKVNYRHGERSARLIYLFPVNQADSPLLVDMLDGLTEKAGEWGVYNLLAEIDEDSPLMEHFRRAGFGIYGWQRIWRLHPDQENDNQTETPWQPARGLDEISIRSLFQNLVPPLAQAANPFSEHRPDGFVYRQGDELLAYVECFYGPQGIVLLPLIHPEVKHAGILLKQMMPLVNPRLGRPIYLIERSYQNWMENQLNDLGEILINRQALLVKRLVNVQRVTAPERFGLVEHRRAESTAPLVNNHLSQFNHQAGDAAPQDSSAVSSGS
ncbi:MAG: hypothetical protein LWX83_00720 [Anaerolineae bacterium]|nr:hypothetical protein [Anaerolineae bacterium]